MNYTTKTCPECNGSGVVYDELERNEMKEKTCPVCDGKRFVKVNVDKLVESER